eukprot:6357569-Ditylum_brightwellii.AAC.1
MDCIDSVTIAAPSPGKMDSQIMSVNSVNSSIMDCIHSVMLDSIGTLSISLMNDDQKGLRRCIHAGSWANVYRFDDPTNACGGKTGAIVVKAISEQYPDYSSIEHLRKEREISTRLSTLCRAVRAPLANACRKDMITDNQGE